MSITQSVINSIFQFLLNEAESCYLSYFLSSSNSAALIDHSEFYTLLSSLKNNSQFLVFDEGSDVLIRRNFNLIDPGFEAAAMRWRDGIFNYLISANRKKTTTDIARCVSRPKDLPKALVRLADVLKSDPLNRFEVTGQFDNILVGVKQSCLEINNLQYLPQSTSTKSATIGNFYNPQVNQPISPMHHENYNVVQSNWTTVDCNLKSTIRPPRPPSFNGNQIYSKNSPFHDNLVPQSQFPPSNLINTDKSQCSPTYTGHSLAYNPNPNMSQSYQLFHSGQSTKTSPTHARTDNFSPSVSSGSYSKPDFTDPLMRNDQFGTFQPEPIISDGNPSAQRGCLSRSGSLTLSMCSTITDDSFFVAASGDRFVPTTPFPDFKSKEPTISSTYDADIDALKMELLEINSSCSYLTDFSTDKEHLSRRAISTSESNPHNINCFSKESSGKSWFTSSNSNPNILPSPIQTSYANFLTGVPQYIADGDNISSKHTSPNSIESINRLGPCLSGDMLGMTADESVITTATSHESAIGRSHSNSPIRTRSHTVKSTHPTHTSEGLSPQNNNIPSHNNTNHILLNSNSPVHLWLLEVLSGVDHMIVNDFSHKLREHGFIVVQDLIDIYKENELTPELLHNIAKIQFGHYNRIRKSLRTLVQN